MLLASPVTIDLPGLGTRTFHELPVTIVDSSAIRRVLVQMLPFARPLTLWEGDAYDAAGDYTQAQAEARVLELLGSDPKAVLEPLFVQPAR
jgi:hypothetical protein